jgi:hypothetical protein
MHGGGSGGRSDLELDGAHGRQDRCPEAVGQLGRRGSRVGGAEDQVIEGAEHGAAKVPAPRSHLF